tara:strand:+ start:391 stop:1266 length:876 start_codon:yes stop_codon:yes gene_type:complete
MTTDLRTLFKEESNKLSIKEKEFKSLILDFENQFKTENTEFNVKFSQIVSKKSIYLSFSLKNHSFTFIYTLDKEKETYNTEYYEEYFSASNSNIKECIDLLSFIYKETKSKTFEELSLFLKNYNSLYNSINRIKNKIRNISSDIAKNKDSGLISKLKFFLSSEKEIIDQNIKDFLNQDEFEKEIVCFDINKYSEKTIEFRNTKLSVSTSSGKRLFKVNKRAVSKKEAINLLKNQVFNNGKEIKHFSQTPCYQKPEKHDPYYSWKKAWSLRVEEYIKLIKPETLIQYNVDTF